MITELTKEQEEAMVTYRDMGLKVGNSTEPADWEKADQAIKELYEFSGLELPKTIYHVESPLAAQKLINKLLNQPEDTFNTSHGYSYGQHEAYWIYRDLYYQEVLGIEFDEKAKKGLDIMKRICESSGYHYLYDDTAIICDRPNKISMNENNEIHCEDGPAISYRDGFAIYAINGHVIPDFVIEKPETITVDMIEKEENAETARIMTEKYGHERYFAETEAKVLDSDTTGLKGAGKRALIEDNKGNKWLFGSDGGTGRTYVMSVPEEVTTCKEAHSAIAGFDESKIVAEC